MDGLWFGDVKTDPTGLTSQLNMMQAVHVVLKDGGRALSPGGA